MRKLHRVLLPTVMILGICLTACSKKHTDHKTVSESAQMQTIEPSQNTSSEMTDRSEYDGVPNSLSEDADQSHTVSGNSELIEVDIDLTGFNANMLYAEVYNMTMSPKDYNGKMIKLNDEFARFPKDVDENGNPTSDEEIFVCIISDAMACCATGVEFIPEKESSFWTSCPEEGNKITVTGICDIFPDESGWFTVIQLDKAIVEQSE